MEDYTVNNIMSEDEIENLFADPDESTSPKEEIVEEDNKDKENKDKTTEVNPEDLFKEVPESVGSEEHQDNEEETKEKTGTSPKNNNFYSSMTRALIVDGFLSNLDEEEIDKVTDAEKFGEVIESYLQSRFDDRQRRIDEALNNGVETSTIKTYENALTYLDNISEDKLSEESEEAESIRKQLIYNDLLHRGYSEEQANRKLQKSIESGNDIEDAKEALEGNKEFFKKEYNNLIEDAKKQTKEAEESRKKQAEDLKKSILNDKKVFGELEVDKTTRQKIYDNINKPIYKDENTGYMLTAIQKYQKDNPTDFLKYIGLTFTLTNGFKDLDGLVKNKVRKEVKKGLKSLEDTLANHQDTGGSLSFVGGSKDDLFEGRWDVEI